MSPFCHLAFRLRGQSPLPENGDMIPHPAEGCKSAEVGRKVPRNPGKLQILHLDEGGGVQRRGIPCRLRDALKPSPPLAGLVEEDGEAARQPVLVTVNRIHLLLEKYAIALRLQRERCARRSRKEVVGLQKFAGHGPVGRRFAQIGERNNQAVIFALAQLHHDAV